MNESTHKFRPLKPQASIIITSILILLGLLFIVAVLKVTINWPSANSETTVLIGVLVFSLLPVLLALTDTIIERGAVIEYGGVKIDFSRVAQMGMSAITVPVNIGVRGKPVSDSDTMQILNALKKATTCDVVIIDLEEGQAWWETRLLVLIAGAERLKKPEKIVFVGTDGGKKQCFQGWAHPNELLPLLLKAHPQYPLSYQIATSVARQWELVEPTGNPASPPQPPFLQAGLAGRHSWMAFDTAGLPNPLLAEQLLAAELGEKLEIKGDSKWVSLVRMEELFRPVMKTQYIDENWEQKRQLEVFFESDDDYIAVTQNNTYKRLISRMSVHHKIIKTMLEKCCQNY
jgi:hypothetical protein